MTPKKLFRRAVISCVLLASIIFTAELKPVERLPLSSAALTFDAPKAFDWMTKLAKGFPNRTPWSDSRRRAAVWLKDEFKKLGYEPQSMFFSETIDGKTYSDLENIYAEKKGRSKPDEIIVLAAHYDITDTTVEGAMDDASGIGVVLELARIMKKVDNERTIVFLLTDSEEFGAFWGARAFAKNFDRKQNIIAELNFDFIAPAKQVGIMTLCDGLYSGYTPLWLREMAIDSVRALGTVEAREMTGFLEHVERALQIPATDHGAFLREGIPSFNWIGQTEDFPHQMTHYHHTEHDVVEAMELQSFVDYGRAAERLLRSIDALPVLPENYKSGSYFKVTANRYLTGTAILILHIVLFIPFLILTIWKWIELTKVQGVRRKKIQSVLLSEAKNLFLLFGALLIGYGVTLLLPALRIVTEYEIFPATQKSPLLYTPNFLAMLLVVAVVGVAYFIFQKSFSTKHDHEAALDVRLAFHASLLTVMIAFALAKNSFLATLLLLPPAYLWGALRLEGRKEDRVFNGIMILGGFITFFVLTIILTTVFHIGVVYWYLFLSIMYGLMSAYTVIMALLAFAIFFRLFRKFVL